MRLFYHQQVNGWSHRPGSSFSTGAGCRVLSPPGFFPRHAPSALV